MPRKRWKQTLIEPVASNDIFLAAIAAALVILFGAAYALFFALGRLQASRALQWIALGCYAALAVSTFGLAQALNLHGYWASLVALMLIGYLLAPYGIWWLCVGTHQTAQAKTRSTPHV